MNSGANKGNPTAKNNHGRHRQVRWFTLLMGVGVIVASGAVVADVVLNYSITNGFAPGSLPFQWTTGGNYVTANDLGIVTTTCNGGVVTSGCSGNQLATTLEGVTLVGVTVDDAAEFQVAPITTPPTLSFSISSTGANLAGVDCAYAIVSNAPPDAFSGSVAYNGVSCTVTAPTYANYAGGDACGIAAGAAAGVTLNLLGAGTVGTALACTVTPPAHGFSTLFWVSYVFYTDTGLTASGPVGTITVGVQAS